MPLLRLSLAWLILLAASAHAQGTLILQLPECVEPGGTIQLQVRVELEPGATLKSYDVRLQFDPSLISFQPNLLTQGAWFQSGGPTFFIGDVIGNQLIVNAALLGPGLAVSGSGEIFHLPMTVLQPGVVDLVVTLSDMYDVSLELLDVISVPSASEAPCTDFQLGILALPGQVQLDWQPQDQASDYLIEGRSALDQPWVTQDSTTATTWLDAAAPGSRRLYRVKARYTAGP
jgi:hypothetical protein